MKIAVAYIPVIHQGYLDFIQTVKPDVLYILGEEFYGDFRPIQKEIRKLSPELICEQLKVSDTGVKEIKVLTKTDLSFRAHPPVGGVIEESSEQRSLHSHYILGRDDKGDNTFILPSEDISKLFAEKYLSDENVEFADFFLRWDAEASVKQKERKDAYLTDTESFEKQMLGLAYSEADKSADFWRQVGAVIVKDKEILIHTYNQHVPTNNAPYLHGDPRGNFKKGIHIELSTALHAEAALVAAAAKHGVSLKGTEMYVTTFPCPNCAKLIAHSGIKKVYFAEGYSMLDGEDIMTAEGVELVQVEV